MHEKYDVNETGLTPEQLLKTPHGMFLLELRERVLPEVDLLIEASLVGDKIKKDCRKIIDELTVDTEREIGKGYTAQTPVENLADVAVRKLTLVLSKSDSEQDSLFVALRESIYKARDSALNWKSLSKSV